MASHLEDRGVGCTMTEYKKTWRVVTGEYDNEQSAMNVLEHLHNIDAYVEETSIPIIEWVGLDAGYGVVGYSWDCSGCGQSHSFMYAYKDEAYSCKACGKEHYSDWEEEL